MDLTSQYCPERRDLEQRGWNLVGKLSALTERLLMLIGKDHQEFMATNAECECMKQEILESNGRLLAHRTLHGC